MNVENTNANWGQTAYFCCGIGPRLRSLFWGSALLLLGSLGALGNFVPLQGVGKYILPAFLALWGVFLLGNALRSR